MDIEQLAVLKLPPTVTLVTTEMEAVETRTPTKYHAVPSFAIAHCRLPEAVLVTGKN